MEAVSREDVFAALRSHGIKPIKVVAADGSKANGEVRGIRKRVAVSIALAVAIIAGIVSFGLGRGRSPSGPHPAPTAKVVFVTNAIPRTTSPTRLAQPLPRQMIPGERQRIDQAVLSLTNAAERTLASFAEPGRPLRDDLGNPTDAEFSAALTIPVCITANELTESIDLKRILAWIKAEMRRYVAGGGSVSGYLAECRKRQQHEVEYRARAEERLKKMMKDAPSQSSLSHTYAYWLKANAQLQSMGIYPIPIPDQLRDYQLSLDIEE